MPPRIPLSGWVLAGLGLGAGAFGGVSSFTGSALGSSGLVERVRIHELASGHPVGLQRTARLEVRVGALETRFDLAFEAGSRRDRNLLRICQKLHVECED